MTTASKTTATERLTKLVRKYDEARIEVAAINREKNQYRTECEALKVEYTAHSKMNPEEIGKDGLPLPGTEADRLRQEVKSRWTTSFDTPWPDQPRLDKAIAKRDAAEEAQQNFRVQNIDRLIEEATPENLAERFTAAWQEIVEICGEYLAAAEKVSGLAVELPMLDGRDAGYDGRVRDWNDMAEAAMANPPYSPRFSDLGRWKVAQLAEQIEAGHE